MHEITLQVQSFFIRFRCQVWWFGPYFEYVVACFTIVLRLNALCSRSSAGLARWLCHFFVPFRCQVRRTGQSLARHLEYVVVVVGAFVTRAQFTLPRVPRRTLCLVSTRRVDHFRDAPISASRVALWRGVLVVCGKRSAGLQSTLNQSKYPASGARTLHGLVIPHLSLHA